MSAPRAAMLCAVLAVLFTAVSASAQLTPDRLYYGIGRTIPMTVSVPTGLAGEAVIQLLAPVTAEVRASAAVVAGHVDLAGLFPMLWRPPTPPTPQSLVYAQLLVGSRKVGPAIVLQPMIEPPYCVSIDAPTREPRYREGSRTGPNGAVLAPAYSGLRAYIEKHIVLETTLGEIQVQLRPDQAPNTAFNFLHLSEGGFYTDIPFHRIVAVNPNTGAPFVVQAGDPIRGHESGNPSPGEGGPGYTINLEPSALPHDFGVLAMARNNLPNSAGSQFFICLSREGTAPLDAQGYCAFAQAVSGGEVIQAIAAVPADKEAGRPVNPPMIKRVRVIDAPPYGDGPAPVKAAGRPVPR